MAEAVTTITGDLVVHKQRFALIVSRFNEFISSRLLSAAVDTLERHGCGLGDVTVIWVPGAWELPQAARRAARSGQFDAVVCLGCVIRGETPHFDYVAGEAAKGIAQAAFESDLPIIFGVLTTETLDQAINRAGAKTGNKGADAALAAIEMANLYMRLNESTRRQGKGGQRA
ncbi:MAG: 6,7-dimethyl-8-ribityllumazine synthase [Phycisphaerae bacterium]